MEITASFVKLSEGTMRYLEARSGEPVVFLPGAGALSGGEGWLQILEGLAREFHVLALDAGHVLASERLEEVTVAIAEFLGRGTRR